jgi:hypothetical protein
LESQLSWNLETSVAALNDPIVRQNRLLDLGREIAWSFGFKNTEVGVIQGMIDRFKERQRWIENKV